MSHIRGNQPRGRFDAGGDIIVRALDGSSVHIEAPCFFSDEISLADILPDVVAVLSEEFGEPEDHEEEGEQPSENTIQWWEWERYSNASCTIERRSRLTECGASGLEEQIIVGLLVASSYDILKKLTARIADKARPQLPSRDPCVPPEPLVARLERILIEDYDGTPPLALHHQGADGEMDCWHATDSSGNEFSVRIDADSVMFISTR